MKMAESRKRSCGVFAVLAAAAVLSLAAAAPAAAAEPEWRIDSLAPTSAAPGSTVTYHMEMAYIGTPVTDATVEPWVFTAVLPPGLSPVQASSSLNPGWDCSSFATTGGCEDSSDTHPYLSGSGECDVIRCVVVLNVELAVGSGASGVLTPEFRMLGGGAPLATTIDPTIITATPPAFGVEGFDQVARADAEGDISTQAGGRAYDVTTSINLNSLADARPLLGSPRPVEPTKDISVSLPPGFLADAAGIPQCSLPDLANGDGGLTARPLCPAASQVGVTTIRTDIGIHGIGALISQGGIPVYNMVPPGDAPARLGFNLLGTIVVIDAKLRASSDYGITAEVSKISQGLNFTGTELTLWGVPSDPVHTPERACSGALLPPLYGGPACTSEAPQASFWRNPTTCENEASGSVSSVKVDSWAHPGVFAEAISASHLAPGLPHSVSEWGASQGPTGCAKVPFKPTLEASPTTAQAESPSGLDLHLRVPQGCWQQRDTICQSDLRNAEVALPQGMTLNPSSATGLAACSSQQIGLITPVGSSPIHFNESPAACPNAAKIGDLTIGTPLLNEPLTGAVYLAKQGDNPFGSLLAMYLVAEGQGVVVKQAGEIRTGPNGQLTTVFRDAPQVPFSDLHVDLFGGTRAPLRTPASCGSYTTQATLTPWSGNPASVVGSSFPITGCGAGGFDPKLSAGTENPIAGTTSPFVLRLQREDGTQELGGLQVSLPPGLSGYLKGISYCPDAVLAGISDQLGTGVGQEASPSCPAASRVGTVTVGAGAGPSPFYTQSGRAYLAGPYKGAPLSLAVVAPAVAGPFDLGSVVVRNAINVDPTSAQLTVSSDPLPTILHGIPLDLRDVRVSVDRDHFTLNPTSCDPMQIGSTITSTQGVVARPSQRFQVANCERLGFKPSLSLKLSGKTHRGGNPGLRAVLAMPQGGASANASRVQVILPHSEFVAQSHLADICTRVQYAATGGGGAGCPAKSVYGKVRAWSPLLERPLEGNVYLRANGGERALPDLVASLNGQIHIEAVGYIGVDKRTEGLKTTFATIPDAPVEKIVLSLPAGKHSLLENSTNICRGTHSATVQMDGHNGKVHDFRTALQVGCGSAKRHR